MQILIRNLTLQPQSLDLPTGDGDMIRNLLTPANTAGAVINIGNRTTPYELNKLPQLRQLVREQKISVSFIIEADDLLGLPLPGAVKDPPARVATTGNIALTGLFAVDGVVVAPGDRVLVRAQTDAKQNGIYVAAAGAWARSSDADQDAEFTPSFLILVLEGVTLANTGWVLTSSPVILGTTDVNFARFSITETIVAGDGLDRAGATLFILTEDGSLVTSPMGVKVGVIDDSQHGTRGGGTQHALATTLVAGFLSPVDKVKIDTFGAGNVTAAVRNESGSTIAKGKLVAVTGYSIPHLRPLVGLADKDTASLRPAVGITSAAIADNANGDVLVVGTLTGVDTSAFSLTDQLVLATNGNFSRPPPDVSPFTGEVQNIGSVSRVDAVDGEIVISIDGLTPVTAAQVFALVGTNGTPGDLNRYVTNSDPRNTDARTALAHAATHQPGGTDAIPTGTPVSVSTANAPGTATTLTRSDHVHAHGIIPGGATHALATPDPGGVAGYLSPADKQKLDGFPATVTNVLTSYIWGDAAIAATTTTRYLTPGFADGTASTTPIQFRVPSAGTLRRLRVRQNTGAGNGNAVVYTVRVNGVASLLTVSMTSTANDGSDLVNTVAIAAGDLIDIEVTKALSIAASPSDIVASLEVVA